MFTGTVSSLKNCLLLSAVEALTPHKSRRLSIVFWKRKARLSKAVQNPLLQRFLTLSLFERKIIAALSRCVKKEDANTKAYCLRLIDFELDCLNPSDIIDKLKRLKEKTISVRIDGIEAYVPLLTDIRYDDKYKKVTITFNSILKNLYVEIKDYLNNR